MNKISLLLLLAISFSTSLFAQSTEQKKNEINKIKKNEAYVYAEATQPDADKAMSLAQKLLNDAIDNYVAGKKNFSSTNQFVTMNTNFAIEQITMPRGNMYRAFLFVKKSDIIPTDNVVVNSAESERIIVGTPTEMKSKTRQKSELNDTAPIEDVLPQKSNYDIVVEKLLHVDTFNELKPALAEMKSSGIIEFYSNYGKLNDPKACILVVVDKSGNIKAVLSEGVERTDLKRNAPCNLNSFRGCSAVGLKVNK